MNKGIFFIGGAQRSGTTYLYSVMDQHPQICMAKPAAPEPKFFLDAGQVSRGRNYYLNKYYSPTTGTLVFGEKSTSYIESREAAERINSMFPQAKMIFTLRNPVARAISNYFFSVSNGLEKRDPYQVFIEKTPIEEKYTSSVSPFKYLERGEYLQYLQPYISIFGRDRVQILIFEDMIATEHFVPKIFEFVGVDRGFKPGALNEKINANEDAFDVDSSIVKALTDYFQPHNDKLEKYLGISLASWQQF